MEAADFRRGFEHHLGSLRDCALSEVSRLELMLEAIHEEQRLLRRPSGQGLVLSPRGGPTEEPQGPMMEHGQPLFPHDVGKSRQKGVELIEPKKEHVAAVPEQKSKASMYKSVLNSIWDDDVYSSRSPAIAVSKANMMLTGGRFHDNAAGLRMMEKNRVEKDTPKRQYCYGVWVRSMTKPTATTAVVWDIVFMLLIVYEVIVIPVQVYDPPQSSLSRVMSWFARIFWTLAIPRTFGTGQLMPNGDLIMDPHTVARNYLRTWLFFDMVIVVSDWADAAMESMDAVQSTRLVKLSRTLRVIKVMRLGRGLKLPNWFEVRMIKLDVEQLYIWNAALRVLKMVLSVLAAAHFGACFWYGIGDVGANGGRSWVKRAGLEHADFWPRYTTSLYWSASMFYGGSTISPETDAERLYAVVITMLALITFGSIVSVLTHTLARYSVLTGQRDLQFALLARFLQQNAMSTELSSRVMHAAHYAVAQKLNRISEHEVQMLETISVPLCSEIRFEVFSPTLLKHPLFDKLKSIDMMALQNVCYFALSEVKLSQGDLLFTEGDLPQHPRMLFIRDGDLVYSSESLQKVRHIEPGDWVSEMVLWLKDWVHLGALGALSYCSVIAADAKHFQHTIAKFSLAASLSRRYAREVVDRLNAIEDQYARNASHAQIDDVDIVGLDIESIVTSLKTDASKGPAENQELSSL